MEASSGKEAILKNVRKALIHSTDIPYPGIEKTDFSFDGTNQDLALVFAERFSSLLGKFSFCESEQDLYNQINALVEEREWTEVYCSDENIKSALGSFGFISFSEKSLKDADVSITICESLVARTGSMVLSSAKVSQLVYDVKDALSMLQKKYGDQLPSMISFATGPSRTADIEKTLVVGVHGPKEVYCFLLDK